MAEHTPMDIDALRKEINALRAGMDVLSDNLRDEADDRLYRAKVAARKAGVRVQNQARQARETVGEQIEERPLTAVFSAFGLGVAVGALLGRKI